LNQTPKTEKQGLSKRYQPQLVEKRWQNYWLRSEVYENAYQFNKNDVRHPSFVIDTPPPFTSGELHIGHAYWNIINDTIARYKRLRGFNVLFPQGWDCQGLPTELKVQKQWSVSRENRSFFRQKCVEWTEQMIRKMKATMIKMGYRPDWEQFEYRTIDSSYQRNVQLTLLQFYERDLIYRDAFPIHWCPNCETALAQAELGYVEAAGTLFHIKFPMKQGSLELATTRPELLAACQAVAVHPEDERYIQLIGSTINVPLFHRDVPVLSDPDVDPNFGTGVVMICTFGDEQDVKWQQKYDLPVAKIVDEQGQMINSGKYDGLKISSAQKEIVNDLIEAGQLSQKEEITHNVLCHTERADCMSPVEFLIKTQFFIKIKPYKKKVIEICQNMVWIPRYMLQRLIDWVNSIEWDWLISRQRVYGTPIPFWYCNSCDEIIPARKEQLPVTPEEVDPPIKQCPKCNSAEIQPSFDVCDCWVDSSITPLIITGYFNDKDLFNLLYPTSIRQQGHDIIRTWLFYTVLRCLLLTDKTPFEEVLINGHILGPDGHKMSKSKGNVVSPETKLDEFGADSLRQTLLSLTVGSDFSFNWEGVKYSKSFLQKYWSVARFAFQFIRDSDPVDVNVKHLTILDQWILSKLVDTIEQVKIALDHYQFHQAIDAIHNFLWHDFCDHYIEAVKYRLYNKPDEKHYQAALYTLYMVLWNITIILSPICPHITEEIYSRCFKTSGISVHTEQWPCIKDIPVNEDAKTNGELIIQLLADVRSRKARLGVPLNATLAKVVIAAPRKTISTLKKVETDFKNILHIEEITYELHPEPIVKSVKA
jgi:valyl-tRNA synthetase